MQIELTPTEMATTVAALRAYADQQRAATRRRSYAGPRYEKVRHAMQLGAVRANVLADRLGALADGLEIGS